MGGTFPNPAPPPVPIEFGATSFSRVETPSVRVSALAFSPGAILTRHRHDRPTLAIVLAGGVRTQIASRWVDSTAESLWTEPAGEVHLNIAAPTGFHTLALQPDLSIPGLFDGLRPLLEEVHDARHAGLFGDARRLHQIVTTGEDSACFIEDLALTILARAARVVVRPGGAPRTLARLNSVRDLLHDRFRERISLRDAAAEIGLHPCYLARAFRIRFGTTVGEYLRRLRLDWAAERLAVTEESVSQIARAAGFTDASHLTRCFSRHYGASPSVYRRLRRGGS